MRQKGLNNGIDNHDPWHKNPKHRMKGFTGASFGEIFTVGLKYSMDDSVN